MYVATHYYHHQHRIPASARLISTEIDTPWQMSSYKYYSDSVSWSGSSDSEYAVREVHLCFIYFDEKFTFDERRVCAFIVKHKKTIKTKAVYNFVYSRFVTRKVHCFQRTMNDCVWQVCVALNVPYDFEIFLISSLKWLAWFSVSHMIMKIFHNPTFYWHPPYYNAEME